MCIYLTVTSAFAQPSVNYSIAGKLGPLVSGPDPLGLNGATFTATTGVNPVGVAYNPSSVTYTGLTFTLTADGIALTCTGATATVTLNNSADGGNDTFGLGNCNLPAGATFAATLAFPPKTLPSPIPLAFSGGIIASPVAASTGIYVVGGQSSILGIAGATTAICKSCPTLTLTPPSPLTFDAPLAGSAPPSQSVALGTASTALAYAVSATTSGGSWLSVSPSGGATGGSFSVSVNQLGLAAGTYSGAITVYTAAVNSPQTLAVNLNVNSAALNLIAVPTSFSFESSLGVDPFTQTLTVTNSLGSAVSFTAAVSTSDGNPWLSVSPAGGTTGGAALAVAADTTKVPRAGTYHGTIMLTAAGFTALNVPVTFRLLGALYSFDGGADGANPAAPLVIDAANVLYGTTAAGGASNQGTVFSLTPSVTAGGPWTEGVVYSFKGGSDGAKPRGPLVSYNGIFYGVTENGGASGFGTVYSLALNGSGIWSEQVLYSFTNGPDGGYPQGRLALASGVLYGTTTYGGKYGRGTAFSLTAPTSKGAPWTEAVLHNFGAAGDGVNPYSGLFAGTGGVLYGTTYSGGVANAGTVFSLTLGVSGGAWTEAVIYSFTGAVDGANPYAGVIAGTGGVLYGTASAGGSHSGGVVFSLTPPAAGSAWTGTVLYDFGFSSGESPRGALVLKSGGLYGTTSSGGASSGDLGTVFVLKPPSAPSGDWQFNVLHSFSGADGATPLAGLTLSSAGIFYGVTNAGGGSNLGTVFLITP